MIYMIYREENALSPSSPQGATERSEAVGQLRYTVHEEDSLTYP